MRLLERRGKLESIPERVYDTKLSLPVRFILQDRLEVRITGPQIRAIPIHIVDRDVASDLRIVGTLRQVKLDVLTHRQTHVDRFAVNLIGPADLESEEVSIEATGFCFVYDAQYGLAPVLCTGAQNHRRYSA